MYTCVRTRFLRALPMDLTTWPESNPCNPGVLGIQSKTARKQISLNPASLKVWVTARAPISQSPIHSSKEQSHKGNTHSHRWLSDCFNVEQILRHPVMHSGKQFPKTPRLAWDGPSSGLSFPTAMVTQVSAIMPDSCYASKRWSPSLSSSVLPNSMERLLTRSDRSVAQIWHRLGQQLLQPAFTWWQLCPQPTIGGSVLSSRPKWLS